MENEDIMKIECINCGHIRNINSMLWRENKIFICSECNTDRFKIKHDLETLRKDIILKHEQISKLQSEYDKLISIYMALTQDKI